MRKLFKGVTAHEADGWMPMQTGNSGIDGEDWVVDTNSIQADMIPEPMTDAKTTALFVSGLLNAYYNNIETISLTEDALILMGTVTKSEEIPSPKNPTLF